jgi:hypothetical protein
MIRGRYGLVIVAVVVAMLSVAAGAGYFMVFVPLPDPSVANRHDLLRWLVLRDLGKESPEIRQKIVTRLDVEFENIGDLGMSIEKLDESRRQMLWHNVTVLLPPWLLGKVDEFSKLPASEKVAYLDSFLNRAEEWSKVAAACQKKDSSTNDSSKTVKSGSTSKLVMDQIQQASDHAAPAERAKIGEFVSAVQTRWLWRQLPSFNFFGKPATTPHPN